MADAIDDDVDRRNRSEQHIAIAADRFEELYGQPLDPIFAWAATRAILLTRRHRQDAEDLLQDTFIRLLNAKGGRRPVEDLRALVYRALTNAWTDKLRERNALIRGGGQEPGELDEATGRPAREPGPDQQAIASETRATLGDCIARLPEHFRAVVALAVDPVRLDFSFRSAKEISTELDIPEGTVKWRLSQARQHLRVMLTEGRREADHD